MRSFASHRFDRQRQLLSVGDWPRAVLLLSWVVLTLAGLTGVAVASEIRICTTASNIDTLAPLSVTFVYDDENLTVYGNGDDAAFYEDPTGTVIVSAGGSQYIETGVYIDIFRDVDIHEEYIDLYGGGGTGFELYPNLFVEVYPGCNSCGGYPLFPQSNLKDVPLRSVPATMQAWIETLPGLDEDGREGCIENGCRPGGPAGLTSEEWILESIRDCTRPRLIDPVGASGAASYLEELGGQVRVTALPTDPALRAPKVTEIVNSPHRVAGAAADDATQLILAVPVSVGGTYTVTLPYVPLTGDVGAVGELGTNPALFTRSVDIDAVQDGDGNYWALAVYHAPSFYDSSNLTTFDEEQFLQPSLLSTLFRSASVDSDISVLQIDAAGVAIDVVDSMGAPASAESVVVGITKAPIVYFPPADQGQKGIEISIDIADSLRAAGFPFFRNRNVCADLSEWSARFNPDIVPYRNNAALRCVESRIKRTLQAMRASGIAAARVSGVAASGGGLVARAYEFLRERPQPYARLENYLKGEVRRVVTLSSPHLGSFLGNFGLNAWRTTCRKHALDKMGLLPDPDGYRQDEKHNSELQAFLNLPGNESTVDWDTLGLISSAVAIIGGDLYLDSQLYKAICVDSNKEEARPHCANIDDACNWLQPVLADTARRLILPKLDTIHKGLDHDGVIDLGSQIAAPGDGQIYVDDYRFSASRNSHFSILGLPNFRTKMVEFLDAP